MSPTSYRTAPLRVLNTHILSYPSGKVKPGDKNRDVAQKTFTFVFSLIMSGGGTEEDMSESRAALYMRLSREDGFRTCEPDSIVSQRLLLMQFAVKNGINVVAEYSDSGVSGTKWERTGLQELLRTIEAGRIDTVLVKDLSRLSRDYLHTGTLLENWFPMHGVRLIAVNDGVDSSAQLTGNDYSPIRAVMDDWYARDISRKVRAAIYARQAAGICTAATLPYGYIRCSGGICTDPDKARCVERIFRIYRSSLRLHAPAEMLNAAGISSPRGRNAGWSTATIRRILQNPAYCGELHIRVTKKTSYKCARKTLIPPADQVVIPVPQIISRSMFDTVQNILQAQAHSERRKHWLSGRATCGECGSRFILSADRLVCSGRKRGNGCCCPSVTLNAVTEQISERLKNDGLPADPAIFPHLVRGILLTGQQMTVFVRCRKPRQEQICDMWNNLSDY